MADANIYTTPLDEITGRAHHEGFGARRKSLGRVVGARRLGLSLFEVPPGEAAYPYHFHLGEEELLVVLDGDGSIRTPSGWRRLARGEVLSFLPGEAGGHQLVADGSAPLRFLAFSTNGAPDLVVYPDSGKLGACERAGDGSGGVWEFYRREDAVPYWHDEAAPSGPARFA
jgi:uncharacterized cupin superfamily protein